MHPLDETQIDLALEIGYRTGQNNQSFKTDSRQAIRQIYQAAKQFEQRQANSNNDYLTAVQATADLMHARMLVAQTI